MSRIGVGLVVVSAGAVMLSGCGASSPGPIADPGPEIFASQPPAPSPSSTPEFPAEHDFNPAVPVNVALGWVHSQYPGQVVGDGDPDGTCRLLWITYGSGVVSVALQSGQDGDPYNAAAVDSAIVFSWPSVDPALRCDG